MLYMVIGYRHFLEMIYKKGRKENMKPVINKVSIPVALHKRMKLFCVENNFSIKDYLQSLVIEGIIRDLKKG